MVNKRVQYQTVILSKMYPKEQKGRKEGREQKGRKEGRGKKGVKGAKGAKGGNGATQFQWSRSQNNKENVNKDTNDCGKVKPASLSMRDITGDQLLAQRNLLKSMKNTAKKGAAGAATQKEAQSSPPKATDSLMESLQKKFKTMKRSSASEDRRQSIDWEKSEDES